MSKQRSAEPQPSLFFLEDVSKYDRQPPAAPPSPKPERPKQRWRGPTIFHRPGRTLTRPQQTTLLVTAVALFGLGTCYTCWRMRNQPILDDFAAFGLHAASAVSKLNSTSAEALPEKKAATPQVDIDVKGSESTRLLWPAPQPLCVALKQTSMAAAIEQPPVVIPRAWDVGHPPYAPPAPMVVTLPPVVPLVVPSVTIPAVLELPAIPPLAAVPVPSTPAMPVYHRGDTPMLRNWQMLAALPSLLTLVVATQPLPADDAPKTEEQLKAIQKQLESLDSGFKKLVAEIAANRAADLEQSNKNRAADLEQTNKNRAADSDQTNKNFASIDRQIDKLLDSQKALLAEHNDSKVLIGLLQIKLKSVEKDVKQMQDEIDFVKKRPIPDVASVPAVDRALVEDMKTRIAQMEKALKEATAQARVSMSLPPPAARIVLVNAHTDDALFIINNQDPVRVYAGMTRVLENQQVGTVRYEVVSPKYGSLRNNITQLSANEVLTLTVR